MTASMTQRTHISYRKTPHSQDKTCKWGVDQLKRAIRNLRVIECQIPNNGKDDSNEKEDQSGHEWIAIAALLGFLKLTGTVIGIDLMSCSAHRNKGKDNISEDKSDTNEGALAADIHHAREKRHQNTRDEECVGQDLDIHRQAMGEKTL